MPLITVKVRMAKTRRVQNLARTLMPDARPVLQRTKLMLKNTISWLPVALCMGLIFYVSSVPGKEIPPLFDYQDIVYHIIIYLILAYFFARALRKTYLGLSIQKVIIFTLVFGIFYAITDELHQSFVPNRTVSSFDVFIDGVGSLFGGLLCRLQM